MWVVIISTVQVQPNVAGEISKTVRVVTATMEPSGTVTYFRCSHFLTSVLQ